MKTSYLSFQSLLRDNSYFNLFAKCYFKFDLLFLLKQYIL